MCIRDSHGLADHHIPDADLAAHVAGNAGEDDALCAVPVSYTHL